MIFLLFFYEAEISFHAGGKGNGRGQTFGSGSKKNRLILYNRIVMKPEQKQRHNILETVQCVFLLFDTQTGAFTRLVHLCILDLTIMSYLYFQ